jgi:hypothetical protein
MTTSAAPCLKIKRGHQIGDRAIALELLATPHWHRADVKGYRRLELEPHRHDACRADKTPSRRHLTSLIITMSVT